MNLFGNILQHGRMHAANKPLPVGWTVRPKGQVRRTKDLPREPYASARTLHVTRVSQRDWDALERQMTQFEEHVARLDSSMGVDKLRYALAKYVAEAEAQAIALFTMLNSFLIMVDKDVDRLNSYGDRGRAAAAHVAEMIGELLDEHEALAYVERVTARIKELLA